MTNKEKLIKIKKLADAMYYAAQYLTTDASRLHKAMDEYHKFIIHECKEEPVSIWHDASKKSDNPEDVVIIDPSDNTGEVLTKCTGVNQGHIWAYTSELLKLDNPCNIGKNLQEPQVKESAEIQHDNETCKENGDSLTQESVINVWHDMSENAENGRNIIIIDPKDFYGAVLRRGGSQLKNHNKERYVKWAYIDDIINVTNKEEPVSEELDDAADNALSNVLNTHKIVNVRSCLEMFRLGAKWQKKRDYIPLSDDINEVAKQICNKVLNCEIDYKEDDVVLSDEEECVKAGIRWQMQKESIPSKDLEELINSLSKRYPEMSFAKLSRIAVRVAKWQKEHLWKPADGNDLPIIDREVIALLDNGKVGFAHRPPEYWDGKNIVTGKVTRYYPKTYGKGGWNMPNVKFWLDCLMPKEIEL